MRLSEILHCYRLGLREIKRYPNAYRESFVCGANDVCRAAMSVCPDGDRDVKQPFAQAMDQIRLQEFGVSNGFNPITMLPEDFSNLMERLYHQITELEWTKG